MPGGAGGTDDGFVDGLGRERETFFGDGSRYLFPAKKNTLGSSSDKGLGKFVLIFSLRGTGERGILNIEI